MPEPDNRLVEFNRLNPVGKAVFIAGSAFKTLGALVDFTVGTIGTVWTEAEKAFADEVEGGSEDGIEDAKIINEDRN
jgi:hypothetical protein